jgi:DNA-binding GntR family transcriptional regulator
MYLKLRLCRGQHRYVPGRGRIALSEHRRVLEAIEDSDGDAAEFLMRRHIAVSRRNLKEYFPTA